MIRLFVALRLPEDLRRRMAMISTGIDDARWVEPRNMHLTLRFIGDVPEDQAEDFAVALSSVRAAPFELRLCDAGHFGSGRRVRAVWIGVEPSPQLTHLRDRIDAALVRAGLAPEHRKFHPHVTLARLRNAAPDDIAGWLAANTLFKAMPFPVDSFALYSSHLGRSGADYRIEAEYPFA